MTIAIDDILAGLDPKTRARVKAAQDVKVEKQKTPSIGLNMALKGGLGYGRQVLVWGNKSAGKSSFCLQMIALAQKEGKNCAWIDAEASYDQAWAESLGVDSASLIYSPAKTEPIASRCRTWLAIASFSLGCQNGELPRLLHFARATSFYRPHFFLIC